MNNQAEFKSSQQGVVLVVGLIFLVLVTLLGTTAMQTTVLEERMAGNMRDYNLALQAGESALLDAEVYIKNNTVNFNPLNESEFDINGSCVSGVSGLCPIIYSIQSINFDSTDSLQVDTTVTGVYKQPRYIIEMMNFKTTSDLGFQEVGDAYFRVTIRAWGANENTVVQLQSIYGLSTIIEGRNK